MKNTFLYKCGDCDELFESSQSKLDAVCPKCGSLHVDYSTKQKHKNSEVITPAQSGYYKALVAKKQEENSGLKEQRAWLLEQVYFLRKAVKFLEGRKKELEDGISHLEKNINIGVSIMEQLEENKDFQQLSEKVERINK